MSSLRIIADNAMSRASGVSASTTAGGMLPANMLADIKGKVWRSTATSATITVTWPSDEVISCVALPYTNLTPAASIRVRAYSDAGVTLLKDTGSVPACSAQAIKIQGWGAAASGVNAYAFGGGASARVWLTPIAGVRQLTIDISDGANPAGYIEVSRLIAGAYWAPTFDAEIGATLTFSDAGSHTRTDAGDLLTTVGARSRRLSLTLAALPAADRTSMANIIRCNGKAAPIFISIYPECGDAELERDYELYGKLSEISEMVIQACGIYSAPLIFESI